MRILVTGASGFVGSHLCRELVANGHTVAAFSRASNPRRLRDLGGSIVIIPGELSDLIGSAESITAFAPDAVAHLGWQGIAGSDRSSLEQVDNIGWTAKLMEYSHKAGAHVFLGVGSQAEYGPKSGPICPKTEPRPTTLYGEAKLATSRIGARLAEMWGLRFVWMRVFSIFGPDDNPHWMLPGLVGKLLRGQRPALTQGDQLWDYLPVTDAAQALRLALEIEDVRGVYNLGSGRAPRLRDTIEAVRDLVDPGMPLGFGEVPYGPHPVMRLQADIASLRHATGWKPSPDLAPALSEMVEWYRANPWVFELEMLR